MFYVLVIYLVDKIDTMTSDDSCGLCSQATFAQGDGKKLFAKANVISFPEKSPSGPIRIVAF